MRASKFLFEMEELSAVWYTGFQWNDLTQTHRQTKAAVAVIVLILCGFLILVIGFVEENLQMKTGGFTMFGLGVVILVCLCCLSYLKDRWSRDGRTRRNESPLSGRAESDAECYELILDRGRPNDEANTSASTRDISILLSRIFGSPPTYEEVATNVDFRDTTTRTSLPPPPYYRDVSEGDLTVNEQSPPSYESSQRIEATQLSRSAVSGLRSYPLGEGCFNER